MPRTSAARSSPRRRGFFGVPSALLLELRESDRRVRVVASTGAGSPGEDAARGLRRSPALEELRRRAGSPARRSTRAQAAALTERLAPEARPGAGQLIAVGADVLVLTGASPCRVLRAASEPLGELFVNAAAAALGQPPHRRDARGAHDPPARAHARGEDAQRVARPRAAARAHLRGGASACSAPTTPPSTTARPARASPSAASRACRPSSSAGRWRRAPGSPGRSSSAAARCSPTTTSRSPTLPAGSPFRRVRVRARRAVRLGRRAARRAQRRLGARAPRRHRGARGAGDLHRAGRRRLPQRQRPRRPRARRADRLAHRLPQPRRAARAARPRDRARRPRRRRARPRSC